MLTWLSQLFCSHRDTYLRHRGDRIFTECKRCGKESPGVLTGNSVLKDFDLARAHRKTYARETARGIIREMEFALSVPAYAVLTPHDVALMDAYTQAHGYDA